MLAILKSGLAADAFFVAAASAAAEQQYCLANQVSQWNGLSQSSLDTEIGLKESICWRASEKAGKGVARFATGVKQERIRVKARSMTDRSARRAWHTM